MRTHNAHNINNPINYLRDNNIFYVKQGSSSEMGNIQGDKTHKGGKNKIQ